MANIRVGPERCLEVGGLLTPIKGTWVPLEKGENIARKYNVYQDLKPLFDFVPGDKSPPPAPKHQNNAAARARIPKTTGSRRSMSKLR
jgi:transcription factor MBP1